MLLLSPARCQPAVLLPLLRGLWAKERGTGTRKHLSTSGMGKPVPSKARMRCQRCVSWPDALGEALGRGAGARGTCFLGAGLAPTSLQMGGSQQSTPLHPEQPHLEDPNWARGQRHRPELY